MKKYDELRSELRNGDIILYHGDGLLSKAIHFFDDAYYNHCGVISKVGVGIDYRLVTLEMFGAGMQLNPLSKTIASQKDFCIIRPDCNQRSFDRALQLGFNYWEGSRKYDHSLLIKIALYKKTGINLRRLGKQNNWICSEWCQKFCADLGMKSFVGLENFTPEDMIRYLIAGEAKVLYDTRICKK